MRAEDFEDFQYKYRKYLSAEFFGQEPPIKVEINPGGKIIVWIAPLKDFPLHDGEPGSWSRQSVLADLKSMGFKYIHKLNRYEYPD
jgi:hypothetical protein